MLQVVVCIGLAVGWAVTLRPTSLGGPATYVVVRGDSMLPDFHSGDLVVLQAAEEYRPGDVVGYRVPDGELGAGHVVLHRIVGGDGAGGYTVEGDNNPAPDPWQPRSGDVSGRLWLFVPELGRVVSLVHQPAVAGALAVTVLVMWFVARETSRKRRPFPGAPLPNHTA